MAHLADVGAIGSDGDASPRQRTLFALLDCESGYDEGSRHVEADCQYLSAQILSGDE